MTPLLKEIEAFLKAKNMKPTNFGTLALNDPPFVAQLRAGRDCKMSTADKVRGFMAEYQPEQVS